MLEHLWLKEELEDKYFHITAFGLVFTVLGGYITKLIFNFHSGLVSVFVISLIAAYPVVRYMRKEEARDEKLAEKSELSLLEAHEEEIAVYISLFIGIFVGFFILSSLMGSQFFNTQIEEIGRIRGGDFAAETLGYFLFNESFSKFTAIVLNNLSVFSVILVISFIFTAGAIFILAWNASVLGVFLSEISKSIYQVPYYVLAYLPHGLIEISAYITAGISGALISRQVEDFAKGKEDIGVLSSSFKDVIILIGVGIVLVLFGGVVEVYL